MQTFQCPRGKEFKWHRRTVNLGNTIDTYMYSFMIGYLRTQCKCLRKINVLAIFKGGIPSYSQILMNRGMFYQIHFRIGLRGRSCKEPKIDKVESK
jgi:hypothetical protein